MDLYHALERKGVTYFIIDISTCQILLILHCVQSLLQAIYWLCLASVFGTGHTWAGPWCQYGCPLGFKINFYS